MDVGRRRVGTSGGCRTGCLGLDLLTLLAERAGAASGSVADIFLPKWFADRIFPICGTTYVIALIVIILRVFW